MAKHNDLGKWGEQLAADKLIADGFAVIQRNWRLGWLEIDIIARRDEMIVFAEVKTRSERDVDPLEAVDKRKISHMVRSAEAFLRASDYPYEVRFDLFAINGTPDDYTIDHLEDAFYPPLKSYR